MKPPPISTPDSCWEASDHHVGEVEDGIVFDPWDPEGTTGSGEKIALNKEKAPRVGAEDGIRDSAPEEMSPSESDGPQDILASEAEAGTGRASTVDDTVPMESENKVDGNVLEKATDDMVCADVGPMTLADDGDWLDDDLLYETEDDGSEYSDSDDSVNEDSDIFLDDIPEFDEDAQQTPWEIEPEEEGQPIRLARDKAADITSLLYLTSRDDQEIALTYLTDLFKQPDYSYPSTFQAIKRIASDRLDFETLKEMVELRSIWRERTDWWKGRYSRWYEVRRIFNGATALSWIAAHRVCLVRKDLPPEMMIDDDWLNEWMGLSHGSLGYLSFPHYIDIKIQNFDAEFLEYGLSQWQQCEKDIDVFERHTAACSVAEVGVRRRQGKRR